MPCLESELHSLAEFIGKILCGIEFKDDNSFNLYSLLFVDNSLEDWKKHLGQLRVKFPSLR